MFSESQFFFLLRREGFELQKQVLLNVASFSHNSFKIHFDFYCYFFIQSGAYKEPLSLLCLCSWVKGIAIDCRRNSSGKELI